MKVADPAWPAGTCTFACVIDILKDFSKSARAYISSHRKKKGKVPDPAMERYSAGGVSKSINR